MDKIPTKKRKSTVNQEEPTSSNNFTAEDKNRVIESLESSLRARESELLLAKSAREQLLKELTEAVECPVCFNIPRKPPVECCSNGHVICSKCRPKCRRTCPTCRVPLTTPGCVSQVAATIIHKVPHACENRDEGCEFKTDIDEIAEHEKECQYRLVHCPHWACDEDVSLIKLTSHVISAECGDNYRDKPLPYREEMEYARALDDEEGNGFWRPSLLQYDGITFYLQVEKCGKTKNWYFYLQMEGSEKDREKYVTRLTVSKAPDDERYSIVYNGSVCPIDVKGASDIEKTGSGLNIRDAMMEKLFVVETINESKYNEGMGEERYKFWLVVDIYKT